MFSKALNTVMVFLLALSLGALAFMFALSVVLVWSFLASMV